MSVHQEISIRIHVFNSFPGLVAAALWAGTLLGQTSAQEGAAAPVRYSVPGTGDTTEAPSNDGDQHQEYAAALDGSGLISMDHTRTTHLLAGSTASFGFDSNPANQGGGTGSGVSTLSPYLGFQSSSPRTQIIGQYQPTITRYASDSYSTQAIQLGSLKMLSNLSERWSVDGKVSGSYGQDSIRFLAPQQTVPVGGVPATGASSASYLANAGSGTNLEASFGTRYRTSQRDALSATVADTFSRFSGIHGENSVVTGTFGYERNLSPTLGVIAYGLGAYYYGTVHCTSVGGGFGVRWQPLQGSYLAVSAGPQFDTSVCKSQQGVAYNVSLGTKLTGRSQIYFLAARQPTVSYLGGGLYQNSVSGGYQRQIGLKGSLSFDLSHVTSSTLATTGAYAGTYFDTVYVRRLGHGLGTSVTYRGYSGSTNGVDTSRNTVMFSLSWTPEAGHILQ